MLADVKTLNISGKRNVKLSESMNFDAASAPSAAAAVCIHCVMVGGCPAPLCKSMVKYLQQRQQQKQ